MLENIDQIKTLSCAILKQAVADCIHLYYRDWRSFSTDFHGLTDIFQFRLISQEHEALIDWMHSDRFTAICDSVGFEDDYVREQLVSVLHNGEKALTIAKIMEMRPEQSLKKKIKSYD